MYKSLLLKTIICFIFLCLILLFNTKTYAEFQPSPEEAETVSATIGTFYLNLSGFIAPNASVVLTSGDTLLRSTVADNNGYFYVTGVLINKGFSNFCLDAIDFKRVGESYTCFQVPSAEANVSMNDIFLPPTLGLQRTEVTVGDEAVAWGFSMPKARVIIHGSDGKTYQITAENTGYYQIDFKIANAGRYEFFADATFQNKQSKVPDKKVSLTALSVTQAHVQEGKKVVAEIVKKAGSVVSGSPRGWLFVLAPLTGLIIFMLKELKPDIFTFMKFKRFHF